MRKIALLSVCLFGLSAFGGEKTLLGTITSTGTAVTNSSTATPFFIPLTSLLSIQCDGTGYLLTDGGTAVTSSTGVKLTTDQFFQTSVSGIPKSATANASLNGALIRFISASGTVNCKVWERKGNE